MFFLLQRMTIKESLHLKHSLEVFAAESLQETAAKLLQGAAAESIQEAAAESLMTDKKLYHHE